MLQYNYRRRPVNDKALIFAQHLIKVGKEFRTYWYNNLEDDGQGREHFRFDAIKLEILARFNIALDRPGFDEFVDEIMAMTRTAKSDSLIDIRLDHYRTTLNNNSVGKWHYDGSGDFRVLKTFIGPGTEWICDKHLDLNKIKMGPAFGGGGALRRVAYRGKIPQQHIQRAQPFAHMWIKGGPKGLLHRSPPLGGHRLLVVVG